MDLPPELSPYISLDTALPSHLAPILRAHVAQLDAEIDQLERTLDVRRQERNRYKQKLDEHSHLQAPIRSIPPEILGTIFRFIFGDEPFGILEYRTYGYLRSVCTTWKEVLASTLDLCKGLEVLLDGPPGHARLSCGDGVLGFEEHLAPWLAIVSRNHPYHLVLGAEDDETFDDSEDGVPDLVHWILTTTPAPTVLSITHSQIFSLVYSWASSENKISHLTLIFDEELDRADLEEVLFEEAFPFLESLAIDAPIDFSSPICHTNIQALSLSNIYGPPEEFSGWLVDMPQLRELKICSQNLYPPIGMGRFPFVSRIPLIHSAVEVLVLEGEDLMLLLEYLTFPSLKFFSLDAQGSLGEEDEVVSSFFQRSCTGKRDFTASFQGRPSKHTFKLFLQNLPICTRLHYALDGLIVDEEDEDEDGDDYNVENIPSDIPYHAHHIAEIFFSKSSADLSCLRGDPGRSPGSELIKLYLPMKVLVDEEVETRRKELREWGYALEILQADAFAKLLRSSIPPMTIEWDM
ncbi:hypothetical protein BKA70DRAFT_693355 [Coprinopsis sp. MPI-PUGE-AT-0042]|nr:hypothetical protein BKA70DRAFT_693355 [Coprinopsis sp. MPI-PUGE-AT-0042]